MSVVVTTHVIGEEPAQVCRRLLDVLAVLTSYGVPMYGLPALLAEKLVNIKKDLD
jgi:hypothetical protein